MKKTTSPDRIVAQWKIVALLFLGSIVLRWVYLHDLVKNNLFSPVLDAKVYHEWAWRIVSSKDIIGDAPFLLNPGYAYILALIYSIFNSYVAVALAVQFIAGALSVVLVYLILHG